VGGPRARRAAAIRARGPLSGV